MKAFAVQCVGVYFVVYADTHAKAKGVIASMATGADIDPRRAYGTLRCRRWPQFDMDAPARPVYEWGVPGTRDCETGSYIEMPCPFKGVTP